VGLGLPGTLFGSVSSSLSILQGAFKLGDAGRAGGRPSHLLTFALARPVRHLALRV
jgi:hypothetical protein